MKKVVSATLAGALAVGMVPAMALADDAVELQALTGEQAFEAGTIVAVDATGSSVNMAGLVAKPNDPVAKFNYKLGVAQYVAPKTVDLGIDGVADVAVDGVNATATYFTTTDNGETPQPFTINGTPTTLYPVKDVNLNGSVLEEITDKGVYWVQVKASDTGDYKNGEIWYSFQIVAPSVKDAGVYQINTLDPKDFSDVTFTYTGGELKGTLGFVLDGVKLEGGVDYAGFSWHKDNGSGIYDDGNKTTQIVTKGSYAAKFSGAGNYEGNAVVPFTVGAANLADMNLAVGAVQAGGSAPALSAVEGETLVSSVFVDGNFSFLPKTQADAITAISAPGAYTYTVKVKEGADATVKANVLGEKDVVVDLVSTKLLDECFLYNGKRFDTASFGGNLDNVNTKLFDAGLVQVKDGLKDVAFDIVVVNKATKQVASVEDINTPGTWIVTVKVDAKANGYVYGGEDSIEITYSGGAVNSGKTAFLCNGSIISGTSGTPYEMTYAGSDLLGKITTSVKTTAGKTLVAGTDYTVEVTNTATNAKVEEILNVGTYKLAIKSTKYSVGTEELYVQVKPIDLLNGGATALRITNLVDTEKDVDTDKDEFVYTGKAIVPVVEYVSGKGSDNAFGTADDVYTAVPAEIFSFGFSKGGVKSAEMVKEGDYAITMTLNTPNYTFNGIASHNLGTYTVVDDALYVDVPSTAWFADEVRLATELKYMGGYYGGKNFGPYDSALREDVAVVIGRMAGVNTTADEGYTNDWGGFESPFSDVEAGAYYAKAVQWINKSGIMTGYSTSDEFGVNDQITRQDLAVALYRYAQKYQKGFEAPAGVAALADYADGAEVSGYAKAAVAWAIEQGIMGVDTAYLDPADDITRAELAAMITRLQPKAL